MCLSLYKHTMVCDTGRPLVGLPSPDSQKDSEFKMVQMLVDRHCEPGPCTCTDITMNLDALDSMCEFHGTGCCQLRVEQTRCLINDTSAEVDIRLCPDHVVCHEYLPASPPPESCEDTSPITPWRFDIRDFPNIFTLARELDGPRSIVLQLSDLMQEGKTLALLATDLHRQNTRLNANSYYNTTEPRCIYSAEERALYNAEFEAALMSWNTAYAMMDFCRVNWGNQHPDEWKRLEEALCLVRQPKRYILNPLVRTPDCCLYFDGTVKEPEGRRLRGMGCGTPTEELSSTDFAHAIEDDDDEKEPQLFDAEGKPIWKEIKW